MLTRWVFRANKEDGHQEVVSTVTKDDRKMVSSNLRPRAISDISFELKHEHELVAERRTRIEKKAGSGKRSSAKLSEREKL